MKQLTCDVLAIGAATRDIFVTSKRFETVPSDSAPDGFNACLPLGAKIPVESLVFASGGGATNAAMTFARFGLKTACITRIGDDPGGQAILAELKREKINTNALQVDSKRRTAYSFILVSGTGSRAILVARGAAAHLDRHAIPWRVLSSRLIYLTSLGDNLALLKDVFAHAQSTHAPIVWNPGTAEIERGCKRLKPYLMRTDILILNTTEGGELVNCPPRDVHCMIRALGKLPRKCLVITDGVRGAYAHAEGVTWHAGILKGKIVNTTGAGDAFSSALTAALFKGKDIPTALRAGTINAFSVVTHMGAHAGILRHFPTTKELTRIKITRSS